VGERGGFCRAMESLARGLAVGKGRRKGRGRTSTA
jgi:hypothetical protein